MRIENLSEDGFINYLSKNFNAREPCLGIGDDAAVIPKNADKSYLVTTDALIERIHFMKDEITPADLGYKTVAVNASDIAAMGGYPEFIFLTIAAPKDIEIKWLQDMMQGFKQALDLWNIQLLGGDTVGSKQDLFISATLIGSCVTNNIKYRKGASTSDIIFVTGFLGNSGAALIALQNRFALTDEVSALIQSHFRPVPALDEGQWLGAFSEVHSLMDVSDGLDQDLRRMMKASSKGAIIDRDRLPLSKELLQAAALHRFDPIACALEGGEDYCLLGTIKSDAFEALSTQFSKRFGSSLSPIGIVTEGEDVFYRDGGAIISYTPKHFDHFSI